MGFFSSLFGSDNSGQSSSVATTSNQDLRLALDNGSLGVSGSSNTLNVNMTDAGAIDAMNVIAQHAIFSGNYVADKTREFATDAVKVNAASVTDALHQVKAASDNALAANVTTIKEALEATTSAQREALAYADKQTAAALGLAGTVNKDSLALADRAQGVIAKTAADALGGMVSVVDKAFLASHEANDASANAVNQVARAYDTATSYYATKSTPVSDYLLYAALAVIGVVALRGAR